MWHETKKQLKQLSRQGNGVFTANSAENAGISKRTFYRLRDAGEIVCISRGVYQLSEANGNQQVSPDYAAIKARVPESVICLISALYHHELTVEIPRYIYLAIGRNVSIPRIDYPAVRFYRMSPDPFAVGVQEMEIAGVRMKIFSPEKTIADCFKYRRQIGLDLAVDALKKYLSQSTAKPSRVLEMAKICRVGKVIKPYLEALL